VNATVDHTTCNGCGLCAKQCSDVFKMTNGKAEVGVVQIPWYLESASRHVAGQCPTGALRVGEAKGLMRTGNSGGQPSWIAL
jgi:ferredoxin